MIYRSKSYFKLLLILILMLSTGCALEKGLSTDGNSSDQSDNGISIGVFESSTGFNSSTGTSVIEGILLAQEQYPKALGQNIHLVFEDAKSDNVATVEAVKKLVEKDKVVAMIGSTSSTNSMAAAPYIMQFRVPTVGATCTNPLVTAGNSYYSRVCFIDTYQGATMANYLYYKRHIKKVAVIRNHTNDYSVGLSNYFIKTFTKLTGSPDSIVIQANYTQGDRDFTAQLSSIKATGVNTIFAPGGDIESALIIQQAKDMGLDFTFAGGDSWESATFLEIGGKSLEGVILSTMFSAEKPITQESKKFIALYEKKYGRTPTSSSALGYDAYLAIIKALEKGGSVESATLSATLRSLKPFEGVTGTLSFDENGNVVNNAVLKEVKDGKFVYLDTLK